MERCLLAAALPRVALDVALGKDSSLHLQLYGESFLFYSALGTLVVTLVFFNSFF